MHEGEGWGGGGLLMANLALAEWLFAHTKRFFCSRWGSKHEAQLLFGVGKHLSAYNQMQGFAGGRSMDEACEGYCLRVQVIWVALGGETESASPTKCKEPKFFSAL